MTPLRWLFVLTCWGSAGAAVFRDVKSVHRSAGRISTGLRDDSLAGAVNLPPTSLEPVVERLPFDALVYEGTPESEEMPASSEVTTVSLLLIGVTLGTESSAIVSGVPGTDGPTLIRAGARVDAIELLSVAPDRVTVRIGGARRVLRFGEPIEVTP